MTFVIFIEMIALSFLSKLNGDEQLKQLDLTVRIAL